MMLFSAVIVFTVIVFAVIVFAVIFFAVNFCAASIGDNEADGLGGEPSFREGLVVRMTNIDHGNSRIRIDVKITPIECSWIWDMLVRPLAICMYVLE